MITCLIIYLILGIGYCITQIAFCATDPERRELYEMYSTTFTFWIGWVLGAILNIIAWPIILIMYIIIKSKD